MFKVKYIFVKEDLKPRVLSPWGKTAKKSPSKERKLEGLFAPR
jgi:hypothetical protein